MLNFDWKYSGSLGNLNSASNQQQNRNFQEESSYDENDDKPLRTYLISEARSMIADTICTNTASKLVTQQYNSKMVRRVPGSESADL